MTGPQRDEDVLHTESGVSLFTGDPFIVLRWGAQSAQLPPDAARSLAMSILSTAEAAESDAAVVAQLRAVGLDEQVVLSFLTRLRAHRSAS